MHVGDHGSVGDQNIAPDLRNDGTDALTNVGNGSMRAPRQGRW